MPGCGGIREACGDLLVFVDDDNLLARDFLSTARSIGERNSDLGVFGAGSLEPEFEIPPPPELRPRAQMLALRTVTSCRWSNNPRDSESIPWGAGLCVHRAVADCFVSFVEGTRFVDALDRKGDQLFAGGDDLFSWIATSRNLGFGIFPELHVIHLIGERRLPGLTSCASYRITRSLTAFCATCSKAFGPAISTGSSTATRCCMGSEMACSPCDADGRRTR